MFLAEPVFRLFLLGLLCSFSHFSVFLNGLKSYKVRSLLIQTCAPVTFCFPTAVAQAMDRRMLLREHAGVYG